MEPRRDALGRLGRLLAAAVEPAGKGPAARLFKAGERAAVAAGVAAVILGTVAGIEAAHGTALTAVTLVISALFAVEYVVRGFVGEPGATGWQRLTGPLALVDLVSAVGVPAGFLVGLQAADARLFGMAWLLRLVRYSPAFAMLARVIREERDALASVLLAFTIGLGLAATGGYLIERAAQPEKFGNIPAALWWAITTLTTTGYGDEVPATPLGRMLAGVVQVCGIAVFGLWAGILASGYAREIQRRTFLRSWDLVARVPLFAEVGGGAIADVARLLRPRDLPAGQAVVRQGESGDCMYFIAEGEVAIELPGGPVRLGEGAFFGEMALITGEPRVATIVTTRATELLVLDVADFRHLAAARPGLTDAIHAEAERRRAELRGAATGAG